MDRHPLSLLNITIKMGKEITSDFVTLKSLNKRGIC